MVLGANDASSVETAFVAEKEQVGRGWGGDSVFPKNSLTET